jgi:hypothetical protein
MKVGLGMISARTARVPRRRGSVVGEMTASAIMKAIPGDK